MGVTKELFFFFFLSSMYCDVHPSEINYQKRKQCGSLTLCVSCSLDVKIWVLHFKEWGLKDWRIYLTKANFYFMFHVANMRFLDWEKK